MTNRITADTDHTSGEFVDLAARDWQLVDRCVSGEVGAWDELYRCCHDSLLLSIKLMFADRLWDANLVEEVAARVWYSVVTNGGELLKRFDPRRGCRLSTFLAVIARTEAASLFRSERRRRKRERMVCRNDVSAVGSPQSDTGLDLSEFIQRLTRSEREFLESMLVGDPIGADINQYSKANKWKLSSRVHNKLLQHFASGSE